MFARTHLQTHLGGRQVRGFTLVELLTTLVIVGILLAASIPRLADNSAFTARGYVDELASALRYAQRVAIAASCDVSVSIDADGYAARLRSSESACDSGSGSFSTTVLRGDGTELRGSTPSGVALAGAGTIVFGSDGRVTSGTAPSFSAGTFTISIDSQTGSITVTP